MKSSACRGSGGGQEGVNSGAEEVDSGVERERGRSRGAVEGIQLKPWVGATTLLAPVKPVIYDKTGIVCQVKTPKGLNTDCGPRITSHYVEPNSAKVRVRCWRGAGSAAIQQKHKRCL
eukprot:7411554-Pyramimonas_sp.AAC.1